MYLSLVLTLSLGFQFRPFLFLILLSYILGQGMARAHQGRCEFQVILGAYTTTTIRQMLGWSVARAPNSELASPQGSHLWITHYILCHPIVSNIPLHFYRLSCYRKLFHLSYLITLTPRSGFLWPLAMMAVAPQCCGLDHCCVASSVRVCPRVSIL